MFNTTLSGIGFFRLTAEIFEIAIVAIVSFFELAFNLIVDSPFRWLIVDSYLDCIIFCAPIKLWFRNRLKMPPDKLSPSEVAELRAAASAGVSCRRRC